MDLTQIGRTVQGFQDQLNEMQRQLQVGFGTLTPAQQPQISQQKIEELLSDNQKKLIEMYQAYMAANPEESEKMEAVLVKFADHVRSAVTAPEPNHEKQPEPPPPQRQHNHRRNR